MMVIRLVLRLLSPAYREANDEKRAAVAKRERIEDDLRHLNGALRRWRPYGQRDR